MKSQLNKDSIKNLGLEKICPICHMANISSFLEIMDVPVHIGLLWSSKDSAQQCPKGNINLGFCHSCGFITNLSFEPSLLEYTEAYDNSLDYSPRFRSYSHSLAMHLIERYNLFNKKMIEIGCGNGYFIILLCELGGNSGVGFDPSYEYTKDENGSSKRITYIKDYYSEQYIDIKADFICCRHVLEHIHNPLEFLTMLRKNINDQLHMSLYFEVPNILSTLRDLAIWDIIYEHCSYFGHESLHSAFTSCNFAVRDLYETFGGQWLAIEALTHESRDSTRENYGGSSSLLAHEIRNFATKYHQKIEYWQENLELLKKSTQRVAIWGAGSKGVSFLNTLKIINQIEYVVDINPNKQGMYIPGTGQQIVSPEFMREYKPDALIIMNPIYEKEIIHMVNQLKLDPVFFYA
jgi:SAM-dependent methyltransferase